MLQQLVCTVALQEIQLRAAQHQHLPVAPCSGLGSWLRCSFGAVEALSRAKPEPEPRS